MYWEMSPDVSTNFRVSWFSTGKDMVYLNQMSLSENTAKYLFNQVLNPPTPQILNSHFFFLSFYSTVYFQCLRNSLCDSVCRHIRHEDMKSASIKQED